ncbi:MAG: hypothetical protein AUK47_24155 [Deltaproteobacteria bacterium CG2_30_63_29]|nr:MAG: hypothetical protein AUK47_24155 [Deltaproteobacteria bacterium CG2_30_63_29]PIV98424.1 MAG: hypothetical protein COW42_14665 [Deltaproteobacteria bacterium CG17_big_fil_post_rev_8_21_14_2_50_63_7]
MTDFRTASRRNDAKIGRGQARRQIEIVGLTCALERALEMSVHFAERMIDFRTASRRNDAKIGRGQARRQIEIVGLTRTRA